MDTGNTIYFIFSNKIALIHLFAISIYRFDFYVLKTRQTKGLKHPSASTTKEGLSHIDEVKTTSRLAAWHTNVVTI